MSKGRLPKKAPMLVALTIAGAGAAAVIKREKIREALGGGGDAEPSASSPNGPPSESEPPVTRFPQPGIG